MPDRALLLELLDRGADGTVRRRQTTFWDLLLSGPGLPTSGELWRITIRRRVESSLPVPEFKSIAFPSAHPLLTDYHEAWSNLYITGSTPNPSALLSQIEALIAQATGGWRAANHYLNIVGASTVLSSSGGLLLSAPTSLANLVVEPIRRAGVVLSVLPGPSPRGAHQLLLLGRAFIIARSFTVRRGPPNPSLQRTRYARR